jgi:hypothetical protein
MMRWNTFARSILFAALAAGFASPWLALARPILGGKWALALYLVAVVAAYLGGLAPPRRRGIPIFVAALLAGGGVAIVASSPSELALGLCAVLAVGRSGFLYRAPAARAVVIEAALAGGGLVFARFLAAHSPLALALALWSFFLVQSFYFLVGGIRVRSGGGRHPDPFQDAYGRALALLEESS